jgi:hypothetical protein
VSEGASALILLTCSAVMKQVARSVIEAEVRGLTGSSFPIEEESTIHALFSAGG